jgi:hypothetical protein
MPLKPRAPELKSCGQQLFFHAEPSGIPEIKAQMDNFQGLKEDILPNHQ